MSTIAEAEALQAVVYAELEDWVPGASQRLIRRAADHLGVVVQIVGAAVEFAPNMHCLTYDWVVGIHVMRCTNCDRLIRV
jgi:hypothetical protein